MAEQKIDLVKIRKSLGNKADGISDEKLKEIYVTFASTMVDAIEQYEKDTCGTTLKELTEGTEKDRFLKMFYFYSDKFSNAIPLNSQANTDWMVYSEDFIDFVKTGKLPSSK